MEAAQFVLTVISAIGSAIAAGVLVLRERREHHSVRLSVEFSLVSQGLQGADGTRLTEDTYLFGVSGGIFNPGRRFQVTSVRLRFRPLGFDNVEHGVDTPCWLERGQGVTFFRDLVDLLKELGSMAFVSEKGDATKAFRAVELVVVDGEGHQHIARPSKKSLRLYDQFMGEAEKTRSASD